jgi:uncharacterized protein (TIGR00255 family)
MTCQSMTGFASLSGETEAARWVWEVRSVNGRGLDLRLRLPEGLETLETSLRAAFTAVFARGSISVSLKLDRGDTGGLLAVHTEQLEAALGAAVLVSELAARRGLSLAPLGHGDLMGIRGVLEQAAPSQEAIEALAKAVGSQIGPLADELREARFKEGARLSGILSMQLTRIGELVAAARETSAVRDARRKEVLRTRVQALLDATDDVDEARLTQELALLAVKADVTEELDRLEAHLGAAAELLSSPGPVGRKFDFLTQEFNREANTLCSKSGATELTAIGLEMKVAIDQMREQIQNVE